MTELLVTPKSLSHLETLIDIGADAFVIGEQKFGLRLPESLIVRILNKQSI